MIELTDVTKQFGDTTALNHITTTFNHGETTVIVGPSGSGKSTLLRSMHLLERPDSGSICIDQDVTLTFPRGGTRAEERDFQSRSTMIFQGFHLFPHLTALENVALAPRVTGLATKEQALSQAQKFLAKVGLEGKENSYASQLSGGQQQRVAIARALAIEPKYLLCDEPTSALDPELAAEVSRVLTELAHEGQTLIIVTHNMAFARQAADRLLYLENGDILFDGSSQAFFASAEPRIHNFLSVFGA